MTRFYHAYLPPVRLAPLETVDTHLPTSPTLLYLVPNPVGSRERELVTSLSTLDQSQGSSPSVAAWPDSGSRRTKRPRTEGSPMRGPEIQATPDQSLSGQTSLNTTVTLSGRPTDSLTNLPRWTLPLSKLTPLTSLVEQPKNQRRPRTRQSQQDDDRRRVSVVCCVMSVESPIQFQKRNQGYSTGWRASWQVSVPSNSDKNAPASCEVMLWDDCARDWGGSVRKGDVVFLQDVNFSPAAAGKGPRITISPPSCVVAPVVLYRTLPRYIEAAVKSDYVYGLDRRGEERRGAMDPEDRALRPDLRLSDPTLRLVYTLAQWCAEWVGGELPG